jgi:hypothetical protein
VSNRLWLNKSEGEWTNNDVQNTTQKIKDWATRTPTKNQGWTILVAHIVLPLL